MPPEILWGAQQPSVLCRMSKPEMIISEVRTVLIQCLSQFGWRELCQPRFPLCSASWIFLWLVWERAQNQSVADWYKADPRASDFADFTWKKTPASLGALYFPNPTRQIRTPPSASTAFNLHLTHLPKIRSKWDLTAKAPFDLLFGGRQSTASLHWTGDTMRKYCETIAAIYERSVPAARGIAKLAWRRERERDNKREKKSGVSPARGAVYAVS